MEIKFKTVFFFNLKLMIHVMELKRTVEIIGLPSEEAQKFRDREHLSQFCQYAEKEIAAHSNRRDQVQ